VNARECCAHDAAAFITKLLVILLVAPLGWTLVLSGVEGLFEGGRVAAAFLAGVGGTMLGIIWWMVR
jgi:hypothetical protein